ncbi:MAG: hypothetical protein HXS53_08365 [Theionarchaea archaeon]|nr:hypothetical protein [Theionarchaea archaeon]
MKIDSRSGKIEEEKVSEQKYHEKHKILILVGSLIILGVILFVFFHEQRELLIALYIILYLLSPAIIFLISRWEESEQDKRTTF